MDRKNVVKFDVTSNTVVVKENENSRVEMDDVRTTIETCAVQFLSKAAHAILSSRVSHASVIHDDKLDQWVCLPIQSKEIFFSSISVAGK